MAENTGRKPSNVLRGIVVTLMGLTVVFTLLGGAGTALIVCATTTLTTSMWAGPTHMSPAGYNWVDVLQVPLGAAGWAMMLAGTALLFVPFYRSPRHGWLYNTLRSPPR